MQVPDTDALKPFANGLLILSLSENILIDFETLSERYDANAVKQKGDINVMSSFCGFLETSM